MLKSIKMNCELLVLYCCIFIKVIYADSTIWLEDEAVYIAHLDSEKGLSCSKMVCIERLKDEDDFDYMCYGQYKDILGDKLEYEEEMKSKGGGEFDSKGNYTTIKVTAVNDEVQLWHFYKDDKQKGLSCSVMTCREPTNNEDGFEYMCCDQYTDCLGLINQLSPYFKLKVIIQL